MRSDLLFIIVLLLISCAVTLRTFKKVNKESSSKTTKIATETTKKDIWSTDNGADTNEI